LTDKERNDILIEDVRRFEGLKKVIGGRVQKKRAAPQAGDGDGKKGLSPAKEELLNLKAVVLGIDWEITDKDLEDLRQEVVYLEHRYAHSKPRLILLQGIGTLGAYIKLKKSDAHADSFKVLHYFYDCLEKMVATPMSLEQEKEILFPAVKEFNAFKAQLGKTVDPEAIARSRRERPEEYDGPSGALAPALADVAADESAGFQADEEAREIGEENIVNVDKHVEGFFDESGWGEEGGPDRAVESVLAADEELAEEVLYLAFTCSTQIDPWDKAFELGAEYMEQYPKGEYYDTVSLTMGQISAYDYSGGAFFSGDSSGSGYCRYGQRVS